MRVFCGLSLCLLFCFPLFKNPVRIVSILVCISLSFVALFSIIRSRWFSYVLFLVYVGGLLVLFIYICLIRRNYSLGVKVNWIIFVSLASLYLTLDLNNFRGLRFRFLGSSNFRGGSELAETASLSVFLFLGVLLLIILLVVVKASGAGSLVVSNEKS